MGGLFLSVVQHVLLPHFIGLSAVIGACSFPVHVVPLLIPPCLSIQHRLFPFYCPALYGYILTAIFKKYAVPLIAIRNEMHFLLHPMT